MLNSTELIRQIVSMTFDSLSLSIIITLPIIEFLSFFLHFLLNYELVVRNRLRSPVGIRARICPQHLLVVVEGNYIERSFE